jgi:hypothetical protein
LRLPGRSTLRHRQCPRREDRERINRRRPVARPAHEQRDVVLLVAERRRTEQQVVAVLDVQGATGKVGAPYRRDDQGRCVRGPGNGRFVANGALAGWAVAADVARIPPAASTSDAATSTTSSVRDTLLRGSRHRRLAHAARRLCIAAPLMRMRDLRSPVPPGYVTATAPGRPHPLPPMSHHEPSPDGGLGCDCWSSSRAGLTCHVVRLKEGAHSGRNSSLGRVERCDVVISGPGPCDPPRSR